MAAAAAYWLWQMIAGPRERSTAESRNPLQQSDILLLVLDYVGPGSLVQCFVAEVSSLWRYVYKKVASREIRLQLIAKSCAILR
jgi:hypothetical protein